MKKICFPRIRKGYGKLVSVLRRRGGRKRTEQLPAMLLEAERCENEQHEDEQHEAMQCEDELRGNERLAVMQHEDERREVERHENEQLAVMQHEAMQRGAERCEDEKFAVEQHEDEQRVNEYHGKAEACNQQQCSLREFCLKRFSEKRDARSAGGAFPDRAKR